jgi:hypothetical protein
MCNVVFIFEALIPALHGRSLDEYFPSHFMQRWPYSSVRPDCCIGCDRRMSYEEMFPRDKLTPRAMCPECYAEWTSTLTTRCPICGGMLEKWRVDSQIDQPAEVRLRLHHGKCMHYFALQSVRSLGRKVGFLRDGADNFADQNGPFARRPYVNEPQSFRAQALEDTRSRDNSGSSFHQVLGPLPERRQIERRWPNPARMIGYQPDRETVDDLFEPLRATDRGSRKIEYVYLSKHASQKRRRWWQ